MVHYTPFCRSSLPPPAVHGRLFPPGLVVLQLRLPPHTTPTTPSFPFYHFTHHGHTTTTSRTCLYPTAWDLHSPCPFSRVAADDVGGGWNPRPGLFWWIPPRCSVTLLQVFRLRWAVPAGRTLPGMTPVAGGGVFGPEPGLPRPQLNATGVVVLYRQMDDVTDAMIRPNEQLRYLVCTTGLRYAWQCGHVNTTHFPHLVSP